MDAQSLKALLQIHLFIFLSFLFFFPGKKIKASLEKKSHKDWLLSAELISDRCLSSCVLHARSD